MLRLPVSTLTTPVRGGGGKGQQLDIGAELSLGDLDHRVQTFRLGPPVQRSLAKACGMEVQRWAMTPLSHSRD